LYKRVKSRRRCAGNTIGVGAIRNASIIAVGGTVREEATGGSVIEECGLDSSGLGWRPEAGSCQHGSYSSVSIKGCPLLDQLKDWYLF
jgi:hypothetical protein